MSVWAELPDGGEFPNGEVYGADSLKCWVSRNWFGVVGSGDFAHYLAGTRVERLRTIKGAFAYAGKRYMAKKEEMPVMEQKPGRYWGVDWPGTPAAWEAGRSGSDRQRGGETAAGHAAIPFGEHAPGEAEISAQEPTVVGRFHGQAVLQRRVLA